jgi:hypothetical protein
MSKTVEAPGRDGGQRRPLSTELRQCDDAVPREANQGTLRYQFTRQNGKNQGTVGADVRNQ